jgi:NADPH:quinone reductase-like Zn-dependent oxidoreductase
MTRTVVAEGYGGPEVLALQDILLPAPSQGQVLVDVRAAGTNPTDDKLYSGEMGRDPAKAEAHRHLQTGHARGKVVVVL